MRNKTTHFIAALLCMLSYSVSFALSLPIALDSYKKLASSRQEIYAECYEYMSQSVCQRLQEAEGIPSNLLLVAHYNAFGKATIVTPAPTANQSTTHLALRLPGQYKDAETGLHYNYRRYYDPETGRYLTQDPLGLESGINLFSYAQADPVNLTDPPREFVPDAEPGLFFCKIPISPLQI
jgi:RHS repeat-associated protein